MIQTIFIDDITYVADDSECKQSRQHRSSWRGPSNDWRKTSKQKQFNGRNIVVVTVIINKRHLYYIPINKYKNIFGELSSIDKKEIHFKVQAIAKFNVNK